VSAGGKDPFALSLSKGRPGTPRGFERLSPNGSCPQAPKTFASAYGVVTSSWS
jgi:hypothetical protein